LLQSARLVTLTGAGGVGKTRLALELTATLLDAQADGVWLVELASIADPSLVAQAVAAVLGVGEQPGRSYQATLCDVLRSKHLLLVLDNCEHVVEACAMLASELLQASPHLVILATSREPLNVRGEVCWPVPALGVQEPAHGQSSPEAVQLFVDRSRAIRPDFALTEDNAAAVAELCTRLDGLPLAIELAAARTRAVPVGELVEMLASASGGLPILTGGPRGVPERQRTLRAAIDWSYQLLDPDEQALFRRLAVFRGCTLEAIDHVCIAAEHGPGSGSIALRPLQVAALDGVESLVSKSLLRLEDDRDGRAWYSMLETVREFAFERLDASDERPAVRRRHALFYMRLAEDIEPRLYGAEQIVLLRRLEREHANFRMALDWCEAQGYAEPSLRLALGLWMFWSMHGHVAEGSARLEALMRRFPARGPGDRRLLLHAQVRDAAGRLAGLEGDIARGRAWLDEALALMELLEDTTGILNALNGLAFLANQQGDFDSARTYFERELAVAQAVGGPLRIANALYHLANLAHDQQDDARARALFEQCAEIYAQHGDPRSLGFACLALGRLEHDAGDLEGARARTELALSLLEQHGDRRAVALALADLASTHTARRDFVSAYQLLVRSLQAQEEIGDGVGLAMVLDRFAGLAAAQGDAARALRLGASAAVLREQGGSRLPLHMQRKLDDKLDVARRALGPVAEAAVAAGQALSRQAAIQEALATAPMPRSVDGAVLSQRESEVAARIARGLTNRQIAEELVVAESTVATHVVHILAKLGLDSRAQVAVWATTHQNGRLE
jgi:predicted ATPase/DNA-binding CsgD family transcriptional regulator